MDSTPCTNTKKCYLLTLIRFVCATETPSDSDPKKKKKKRDDDPDRKKKKKDKKKKKVDQDPWNKGNTAT